MKKTTKCIVVLKVFMLLLLLNILPVIKADAATTGDDFDYITAGSEICITGYSGNGGAVEIPGTIDGKTVIEISPDAFEDCISITSITIPDTIT